MLEKLNVLKCFQIPNLQIGRKMPGCGLLTFEKVHTIVVAGGEDSNGICLNDVEILQFQKGEYVIDSMTKSSWKSMPSLNFARSNFPSVGLVKGLLTVAAGDVDSTDHKEQVLIEQFDEDSESWTISQDALKTPRFGHSTLKVSKDWCEP